METATEDTATALEGDPQKFGRAECKAAVQENPGCTSAELAIAVGIDRFTMARRLSDCADVLRSPAIFRGASRVCHSSNRKAITWWPNPVGPSQAKQA